MIEYENVDFSEYFPVGNCIQRKFVAISALFLVDSKFFVGLHILGYPRTQRNKY